MSDQKHHFIRINGNLRLVHLLAKPDKNAMVLVRVRTGRITKVHATQIIGG